MKKLTTFVFTTAAVVLSGVAFAGDTHTPEEKVKMLDTDMDNQVSLAEATAGGKTQEEFAKMDINGDGFVTAAEFQVGKERGPTPGEKKDVRSKVKPQPTSGEPTGQEK
jgi:hypothetical protein